MRYRRADTKDGTHFFTVNLAERSGDTLARPIDDLRAVIDAVKAAHALSLVAMVVLLEHLHAIWRLPPGDADYPMRWSLIKAGFQGGWTRASTVGQAGWKNANAAPGNGAIGSIKSAMMRTWRGTWITCTTTR